ncbi:MAG: ribonuclease Z [Clostridia bacterium]|nr:ribonuclease Z [Clostridia bacterium]
MKITFVGTSHGVPAADRFCSCYMIESGGKIYMVDAGAPAAEMILRYGGNINDFRALFTTHVHGDHTAGMVHLISLMNWYYKQSSADFFITEQAHLDATLRWLETSGSGTFEHDRLHMKVPAAGVVYEDENIKAEYIPTKHMPNSYSILITEGETRVLFGGDFSGWLKGEDVPEIIKEEIDGFVCEMAHFGMTELAPYLEDCRAKRVIFSHVFPVAKYGDIEAIKGKYAFEVLTPADGDVMEI